MVKLYDYGKLKLENGQFTEETGNILKDVIKESEKYDFIDILHNANKSFEFYQEKINSEKKEKLRKLYNLAKEKIKSKDYNQEAIDILDNVLEVSEHYGFSDIYEEAKKSLEICKKKNNLEN